MPELPSPFTDLSRPPLNRAALLRALVTGPTASWRALELVARTGSTNADLAERARAAEPGGLVLVADQQSAGRGRLDRTWTAPARAGLAVSVLLRPDDVPVSRWAWLPLLAGVAVADALARAAGVPARLKWPNDVLLPDGGIRPRPGEPDVEWRKVAGLLVEVVPGAGGARPAAVLGIGLNVSQAADELPVPTATSLRLAGGVTDREIVLRAVLRELADRYRVWAAAGGDPRGSGLAASYRERCRTIGSPVRVQLPDGSTLAGTAEGVDDEGRLIVTPPEGQPQVLSAGDVVHVRGPEPA